MAHRNFARGEAPPHDSWEWAGVAKPPDPKPRNPTPPIVKGAAQKPVGVILTEVTSVTLTSKSPRRKWPWILAAAAGIGGYLYGKTSH